jgi:Fic family protein
MRRSKVDRLIVLFTFSSMEYEKTHPWIRFAIDLRQCDHRLWLKLGEIAAMIDHLSGAALRPDVALALNKIYLTKGVRATTAIEGNTLSEEQVQMAIDGKLDLPKSQRYLQIEVQNILDICNQEAQALLAERQDPSAAELSLELMKRYNCGVLNGLELSEGTIAGQIRTHSVLVGSVYRGAPARDCDFLLKKLCHWLGGDAFRAAEPELRVPLALVKAIVAHVYFAWIHPFGDGNGRTARLVEFHILLANGVPMPAAHLLSDHYNLTRSQYYKELQKASASGGDLIPFISYAVQGFLDGIRDQIKRVREQQLIVAWENYVHDRFGESRPSKTQKRRRDLVLELSKHEWVDVAKIELLSPRIAREYAAAGNRMVQRDLNELAQMKLIERRHGKVLALKHLIQAFIPARVKE